MMKLCIEVVGQEVVAAVIEEGWELTSMTCELWLTEGLWGWLRIMRLVLHIYVY